MTHYPNCWHYHHPFCHELSCGDEWTCFKRSMLIYSSQSFPMNWRLPCFPDLPWYLHCHYRGRLQTYWCSCCALMPSCYAWHSRWCSRRHSFLTVPHQSGIMGFFLTFSDGGLPGFQNRSYYFSTAGTKVRPFVPCLHPARWNPHSHTEPAPTSIWAFQINVL